MWYCKACDKSMSVQGRSSHKISAEHIFMQQRDDNKRASNWSNLPSSSSNLTLDNVSTAKNNMMIYSNSMDVILDPNTITGTFVLLVL